MIRSERSDRDHDAVQRCQQCFSEYTLLVRRGRGGQGSVFSAVHHRTGRKVAIKLLDGALVSERHRQRFLREIDLISRLRHPHIVTVYDFNLVDDHPYYVMDLISGLNLLEHVDVYGLDVRRRVELFLQVCDAVSCAHRSGVIHRDLKPSNILVDETGCPFVVDFGLAKAVSEPDDGASETCVVVGTIPYMSPEQSLGSEADALGDVYALGVILFEQLTEQLPFDTAGSREAVLDRMRNRPPRRFEDVLRDQPARLRAISRDLRAIVYRAIAKAPAERYQSVAALAEDLRRHLAGRAVEARADQGLYVLAKAVRRYRGTLAAIVVVLLGLGAALWQRLERLDAEQGRLQAEREKLELENAHLKALDVIQGSQAKLNVDASIKLASVSRDAGRIGEAVELLKEAVVLAESIPSPDQTMRRGLFESYLRLGEIQVSEKKLEAAEEPCRQAMEIARAETELRKDDEEWQRLLGFAYRAAGRLALERDQRAQAASLAAQCIAIRQQLAEAHPERENLQLELAVAMELQARCSSKASDPQESLKLHLSSNKTLSELYHRMPENGDYAIEYANSCHSLVVWHMQQRTPEHDAEALLLLDKVDKLVVDDALRNRAWELKPLRAASAANRQKIVRRLGAEGS